MNMTPDTRLDVEVQVLVHGRWWPGFPEHARRVDDGWEGFVRWTDRPGQTRIGWHDSALLRPRPGASASSWSTSVTPPTTKPTDDVRICSTSRMGARFDAMRPILSTATEDPGKIRSPSTG